MDVKVDMNMESSAKKDSAKKGSNKVVIVLLIIIILLLIGVIALVLLRGRGDDEEQEPGMGYEANVITDEESAQRAADAMKAPEGAMTMKMTLFATSYDGENFSCELWNSEKNSYDLYLEITNDEDGSLIYRSGLIPVGSKLESFTTENKIPVGSYPATVTFHQMEDDHVTEHAAVSAGYTVQVSE